MSGLRQVPHHPGGFRRSAAVRPTCSFRKDTTRSGSRNYRPRSRRCSKRLSSSRLRSAQSLKSYADTAVRFFETIGAVRSPTEQDWHDYFMVRRRQGVAERTLTKEFYYLKKLAATNHYDLPFDKEDVPHSMEDPYAPTFSVQQVEQLIKAWPKYSTPERFYLAVSTVWGHRSTNSLPSTSAITMPKRSSFTNRNEKSRSDG